MGTLWVPGSFVSNVLPGLGIRPPDPGIAPEWAGECRGWGVPDPGIGPVFFGRWGAGEFWLSLLGKAS